MFGSWEHLKYSGCMTERLCGGLQNRLIGFDSQCNLRWLYSTSMIVKRTAFVTPDHVGQAVKVHRGNRYVSLRVVENMIGYRFGEFVPTRSKNKPKPKK